MPTRTPRPGPKPPSPPQGTPPPMRIGTGVEQAETLGWRLKAGRMDFSQKHRGTLRRGASWHRWGQTPSGRAGSSQMPVARAIHAASSPRLLPLQRYEVTRRGRGKVPVTHRQIPAAREDTRPTARNVGGRERPALDRARQRGRCRPESFFLRALAASREPHFPLRVFQQKREAGLTPDLPVNATATAYWRVRKNPAAPLGLTVYGLVAPLTSV